MYENHRKNFPRGEHRDFGDDRYRFGDDRFREGRGRYGSRYFEGDRGEHGAQRPGYGSSFRDDEQGRYSGYGPDGAPEYWHNREDRGHFAHDPQHHQYSQGASSFGYGAGQPYGGGEGDSRYFTGQQGSWALRSPGGARGRQFGRDYREHGYGAHDHDDDERGFWNRASDEVASWFGDDEAARRRELDHRGRGPKDYIRSDERIREDANDRLTEDARVDASNVTLTVQSGEITLNGTVGNRHEKRRAEDVVERISGVKHVQNNLRVAETTGGSTTTPQSTWTVNPGTAEGGTIGQPKRQTTKA